MSEEGREKLLEGSVETEIDQRYKSMFPDSELDDFEKRYEKVEKHTDNVRELYNLMDMYKKKVIQKKQEIDFEGDDKPDSGGKGDIEEKEDLTFHDSFRPYCSAGSRRIYKEILEKALEIAQENGKVTTSRLKKYLSFFDKWSDVEDKTKHNHARTHLKYLVSEGKLTQKGKRKKTKYVKNGRLDEGLKEFREEEGGCQRQEDKENLTVYCKYCKYETEGKRNLYKEILKKILKTTLRKESVSVNKIIDIIEEYNRFSGLAKETIRNKARYHLYFLMDNGWLNREGQGPATEYCSNRYTEDGLMEIQDVREDAEDDFDLERNQLQDKRVMEGTFQ